MNRILITGASSMIGRHVVDKMNMLGYQVYPSYHKDVDLLCFEQTYKLFKEIMPNFVVHCAGYNGNIDFNRKYPSDIFYRTTQIGLNVLRCSEIFSSKTLSLLSSCAYPDELDILPENTLWKGLPNNTVECHGLAKRFLHAYAKQIYKQSGLICTSIILNTCYGPHDSFEINKTKVVGGLIRKFMDAVKNNSDVECWGSGKVKREFIYVKDVVNLISILLFNYNSVEPLNIGTGKDITILELANIIKELTGFKGKIYWNLNYPDGQQSKLLDVTRMKSFINYEFTTLETGLSQTLEWYKNA